MCKSFKYCYGLTGIALKMHHRVIKKGVILCIKFNWLIAKRKKMWTCKNNQGKNPNM